MEYLTPRRLHELAPGAAPRRGADKDRLLDTAAVLTILERVPWYMSPVFAMQGTTHEDSEGDPKDGRHLVVASARDGLCVALLNSHCKLMRVQIGLGLWDGEELLLGATLPVQRWRGVYDQLATFNLTPMRSFGSSLRAASLAADMLERLASKVAATGYIAGRGRPSVKALIEAVPNKSRDNMLSASFAIVKAARAGNLAPSGGSADRRNVKGIRRPDALFHIAKATLRAAVAVAHGAGRLP